MRNFAATGDNGLPVYTVQPSDVEQQLEGSMMGPYTMRLCPSEVSADELLNKYYWKEGWKLLPPKPAEFYVWGLEAEAWRDPRTLEDTKIAKNSYINSSRLAANATYFKFAGKSIAVDQLSRGDIDAVNGIVSLTNEMPADWQGAWKAIDNTYVSLPDKASWVMFYKAMVGQGSINFAHSQVLKARLAAATTIEQVEAIVW
jgi:hypothetical protein